MSDHTARPLTLTIEPCRESTGAYRWSIRCRDGRVVQRSPYAFASRRGAAMSGACWLSGMRAA